MFSHHRVTGVVRRRRRWKSTSSSTTTRWSMLLTRHHSSPRWTLTTPSPQQVNHRLVSVTLHS